MLSRTRVACLGRTTPHCRSRPAASRLFVTSSAASIREERRIFDSAKNAMASTRALHPSSKVSSALKPVVYNHFLLFGASIFEQSSSQQRGFALAPRSEKVNISCRLQVLPTLCGTSLNSISDLCSIAYIRRLDVVNRGFRAKSPPEYPPGSESNSRTIHGHIVRIERRLFASCPNEQPEPLEQFKKNSVSLVNHSALQTYGTRVILVTPLPVEERRLKHRVKSQGYKEMNQRNEVTKQYADASREVAEDLDVGCLDLWTAFIKTTDWKADDPLYGSIDFPENEIFRALIYDGLRFTPKAYGIFYEEIIKTIASKWPDQIPEKLPYNIPA